MKLEVDVKLRKGKERRGDITISLFTRKRKLKFETFLKVRDYNTTHYSVGSSTLAAAFPLPGSISLERLLTQVHELAKEYDYKYTFQVEAGR